MAVRFLFQMLRELKASHNNGTGLNNRDSSNGTAAGPSSTFYVPNVPPTGAASSSDYIEEDEISAAMIPSRDEAEEEEESCYQEPFDATKNFVKKEEPSSIHLQTSFGNSSSFTPTTVNERPSNESFSETFARHLRRRLSSTKTSNQQQLQQQVSPSFSSLIDGLFNSHNKTLLVQVNNFSLAQIIINIH